MIGLVGTALALTGDYSGVLAPAPGVELPIVFHFDGAGGTMDSPSQGATGIPVQVIESGPKIRIVVERIGGSWSGERDGERLTGTWSQGAATFPLELTVGLPERPDRPQTPVQPLPYTESELQVPVLPGVVLAGTLTTPAGKGPHPYVVMITGSGPQDRHESLLGHQPFRVIADRLARAGIGSYRYDDRGIGASTGDFGAATSKDFAVDAAAALAALRARGLRRIGYLGHSEGALIAPLSHGITPADFLVLLAPPGVPGSDLIQLQALRIAEASGVPAAQLASIRARNTEVFGVLTRDGTRAELQEALQGVPDAEAQLKQLDSPWFRTFVALDPAVALASVEVPVLALIGGRDLQVPPDQNLPALRGALAGNKRAVIDEVPGLNHLFQPTETGLPAEYGTIETTFDEATLARIVKWIR